MVFKSFLFVLFLDTDLKLTFVKIVLIISCVNVSVAAGLEHTLFLTNKGEVFVSGNGEVGQLGILLPTSNKQIHTPGNLLWKPPIFHGNFKL
jgi:alpha-tubulin suppressor-like RCC1 family protein